MLFILGFNCFNTHAGGENANSYMLHRVIGGKAKYPSHIERICRVISIKWIDAFKTSFSNGNWFLNFNNKGSNIKLSKSNIL